MSDVLPRGLVRRGPVIMVETMFVLAMVVLTLFVFTPLAGATRPPAGMAGVEGSGPSSTVASTLPPMGPSLGPSLGPSPTAQPGGWPAVGLTVLLTVTPLLTVAALVWTIRKPLPARAERDHW